LVSRNNLAGVLRDLGRVSEAFALYERTLADQERVLGAEHPDTLVSRNNLAGVLRDLGRVSEAFALYERTLADRERVLGAEHPDTLVSRNNLARMFRDLGRLDDAVALYEKILKSLLPQIDHSQSYSGRRARVSNRAAGHADLSSSMQRRFERDADPGDLDAAIEIAREAVRTVPADHPDRAAMLSNLGIALRRRSRLTGSKADLDESAKIGVSTLNLVPATPRPLRTIVNRAQDARESAFHFDPGPKRYLREPKNTYITYNGPIILGSSLNVAKVAKKPELERRSEAERGGN
jgi:tetratricopeptide (TPR) repeat protein